MQAHYRLGTIQQLKRLPPLIIMGAYMVVVDVTTLEMARKPVKLQKESPKGANGVLQGPLL